MNLLLSNKIYSLSKQHSLYKALVFYIERSYLFGMNWPKDDEKEKQVCCTNIKHPQNLYLHYYTIQHVAESCKVDLKELRSIINKEKKCHKLKFSFKRCSKCDRKYTCVFDNDKDE